MMQNNQNTQEHDAGNTWIYRNTGIDKEIYRFKKRIKGSKQN